MKQFTNQFSLSKTLRFELIPQGKTKEFIEINGLIEKDNERAVSYKKVKKIIDEYHKYFIEMVLCDFKLHGLETYETIFNKKEKDDTDKKEFDNIRNSLRKQIADAFAKNPNDEIKERFKNLFAKELIKQDLLNFVDDEQKELVNEFKDFTTYFTGFHQNRRNMYVADEKATAIAYRLVNENLPKFIDNLKIYEKIKKDAPELISDLNKTLVEMEEIVQGKTLDEIFSLSFFNQTLTQTGIELYNIVIGGRTADEGKTKIKGLNEYINTDYNQKQTDKKKKQAKFKQLYKQILSDRHSVSFVAETFETDAQLLENIEQFYSSVLCNYEDDGHTTNIFEAIKNLIIGLKTFDLSKIYLRNDTSLTDISQKLFGDWSIISSALNDYYEKQNPISSKEKQEKYDERKAKWLKQDFNIETIQTALNECDSEIIKEKNNKNIVSEYFAKLGLDKDNKIDLLQKIHHNYVVIKDLLNEPYPENIKLGNQKEQVSQIKDFLDSILNLIHFLKPLSLKDKDKEKDELFYSLFTALFEHLSQTISIYNKVRNYLTQKAYSTEKIKLNFENSTLLNGWDVNKEPVNTSVIFRKNGLFYLGIMSKSNNRIFERNVPVCKNEETAFEKMNYKLLPGANKMLPKVFLSAKGIESFQPSAEIQSKYQKETHKKGDAFVRKDMENLIDFFKQSIAKHTDWKHFNHQFSKTETYNDLSEFYKEVEKQGYKLTFTKLDETYINQLVDEGKLYLFQIYNKDFSPFSKGKPNMHTLYWKMLFDEQNLQNVVYKLNGEAEVFFRQSSIKQTDRIIHKANQAIDNKNPLNNKKQSSFNYDLIKDKRFTLDKFQFHVPITLNFKAEGNEYLNTKVNEYLKSNSDVKIIGLDRGERHLIYLTLINQKGELLKQQSLNVIATSQEHETDYKNLLVNKENERANARQDWKTIETIKELKEGYLSQVVHQIATMMVDENAIVVMEDLNAGFMRGRQKVERQVYQKLEKMLIEKLNYLVFKNNDVNETAGVLNALQLTNKFESFEKMGKQSGFLFYVPAWNTSKIDPATGFVDFLKPKYESVEKAKLFFEKFESIKFNADKNYFEFEFDYKKFTEKAEGSQTKWTVCTHSDVRYRYNPQTKASDEVNVTNELKLIFDKFKIEYKNGKNLKTELLLQDDKQLFSKLLHYLALTLMLRQSKSGTDIDFILSPVAKNGVFYDSRNAMPNLPKDADANGAFHIALKGLWCVQQIKKADDLKKIKLAISNKEWLSFVQNLK